MLEACAFRVITPSLYFVSYKYFLAAQLAQLLLHPEETH